MPAQDESSSQTIHIQLPDLDAAPPSATPKTQATRPVAAPKTIRLKAPSSVQVKKFATGIVEAEAKEEGVTVKDVAKKGVGTGSGKKDTSKVPMPPSKSSTTPISAQKRATGTIVKMATGAISAKAATGTIGASQTVRITPMTAAGAAPTPGSSPIPGGHESPSGAQVEAAKRKTSRISLEAALSGSGGEDASRPKTIRLKRPGEAATVKVKRPAAAVARPPAVAATTPILPPATSSAKKTAEIQASADTADASVPMTRRKTIRVKRPTARSGAVGGAAVGDGAGTGDPAGAPPPMGGPMGGPMGAPMPMLGEKMNPVFPVFVVLTLLVSITLIWMYVAQACGQNDSLTELASFGKSVNISWLQD